jgi:hypothetical protein
MSRWADTFAALSRRTDTSDAMRHSCESRATVSKNVNTVMTPSVTEPPTLASDYKATVVLETGAESAAIVKYNGKAPPNWVEGFARLDPNRALADVPLRRWVTFISDCGRFLGGGFAAQAEALGCKLLDMFGCDRGCAKTPAFNLRVESSSHLVNLKTKSSGDGCSKRAIEKTVLRFLGSRTFSHGLDRERPFARLDRAGLLWLLNGDRVIALTEKTATVETSSGARQTWRRKHNEPGRALPWELANGGHE